MTKRIAMVLVSLVTACGGQFVPDVEVKATCNLGNGVTVFLTETRDCACLGRLVEAAESVVRNQTHADTRYLDGVSIYLHKSDDGFENGFGDNVSGVYRSADDIIETERYGGALVHEMFHAYEVKVLGISPEKSNTHSWWAEKGYYALDQAFVTSTVVGQKNHCD